MPVSIPSSSARVSSVSDVGYVDKFGHAAGVPWTAGSRRSRSRFCALGHEWEDSRIHCGGRHGRAGPRLAACGGGGKAEAAPHRALPRPSKS